MLPFLTRQYPSKPVTEVIYFAGNFYRLFGLYSQTRFLWQQASTSSSPTPTWAINNVYIGPPCPDLCANNGRCVWNNTLGSPYCVCDPGFSGNNCNTRSVLPPTTLKDDFDNGNVMNGVVSGRLGGGIDTGCGTLSSGKSLYFSAASLRAAATVELDTRNTRSVLLQTGSMVPKLQTHSLENVFWFL